MKFAVSLSLFLLIMNGTWAEDGYRLWLRYDPIPASQHDECQKTYTSLLISGNSPTNEVISGELKRAFSGFLGSDLPSINAVDRDGVLVIGTPTNSQLIAGLPLAKELTRLGEEGYCIQSTELHGHKVTIIASVGEIGTLYGTFDLLRRIQTGSPITNLSVEEKPKLQRRLLDHWDNLDETIERGYGGKSLWKWNELPEKVDDRLRDYGRANASIGINGAVLNNVNASSQILSANYLKKVAAIADTLRPYGIRVYLTSRFSAPIDLGGLKTADPLDPTVIAFWKNKADEIYTLIPDFGGFLVKANSEGQPGPLTYHRTHVDGANLLANALASHGGIVMWRAFVYGPGADRAADAYNQLHPLDGQFAPNVVLQVKNGPVDFMPREPFHPLFGAMPKTALMAELEITQEYLGHSNHLVFLGTTWKEVLDADTHTGPDSTVANILEGHLSPVKITGVAGVSNVGDDRNWCGHPFAQANWYAFGRLAWNPSQDLRAIARDWVRMTWTSDAQTERTIEDIMMTSREAVVSYEMPMGLAHIMDGAHYGPHPSDQPGRPEWNPTYYHRADSVGIGFDRTAAGTNAVACYSPTTAALFSDLKTCPENLILWFHHVPWDYRMSSNRTVWDELCLHYQAGVDWVDQTQTTWNGLKEIDPERKHVVAEKLSIQDKDAKSWRDVCLNYFQTYSKRPFPENVQVQRLP